MDHLQFSCSQIGKYRESSKRKAYGFHDLRYFTLKFTKLSPTNRKKNQKYLMFNISR